jgi:hypothetical protein
VIRARVSMPRALSALVRGALVLGLAANPAAPLWAQAPYAPYGQGNAGPAGGGPMAGGVNSPNMPSNYNPSLGNPYQPTQGQRPASWPGGDPSAAAPPRRQAAPAFGSAAGGASSGTTPARQPELVASSAIERVPPVESPLPPRLPPDKMKLEGAELVARVGSEVILAGDLLYDTDRLIARVLETPQGKALTPEQIQAGRMMYFKQFLKKGIETKLLYAEGKRGIPVEGMNKMQKHFDEQFDKFYLRKMIEGEGVGSRTELEAKLRRQGTTIESLRRQAFESSCAARCLEDHVKDDVEITHEDLRTYYREHIAEYEKPPRARWEHVMARFDKFPSKDAAFQEIASWGNQIVSGTPLADIAKAHSQDPSSVEGGVHSWTDQGSLASEALDRALFTLPVDKLSQIIEDTRGFHIIRIIERDDVRRTPFTEAQVEIKKKIKDERSQDRSKAYLDKLRANTPVWTIFDETDASKSGSAGAFPKR